MLIDFHTHIFPDKIAHQTVDKLKKLGAHMGLSSYADGTVNGLARSMKEGGVDYSVNLPVATSPGQFESINNFAASINGKDNIFSFGSIHPDCEDIEFKLNYIKSIGLRGIKLHPDYQLAFIHDPRYIRIIEHCLKTGLYITFHAGYDPGYPKPIHCPAKLCRDALLPLLEKYDEHKNPHIILAHLGGATTPEDSLEYLCGLPVYMDMAYTLQQYEDNTLISIIRKHGADKILFASDSPWQSQKQNAERFWGLNLTVAEKELISHKNGLKILGFDI